MTVADTYLCFPAYQISDSAIYIGFVVHVPVRALVRDKRKLDHRDKAV